MKTNIYVVDASRISYETGEETGYDLDSGKIIPFEKIKERGVPIEEASESWPSEAA